MGVQIQLWDFDQNNDMDRLELVGEPVRILRLSADSPRAKSLTRLREQMATPGRVLHRHDSLPVENPLVLIEQLCVFRSQLFLNETSGSARVLAMTSILRAVDERISWQGDRLPQLFQELEGCETEPLEVEALSPRRSRVTLGRGARKRSAEVWKKGTGWRLASPWRTSRDGGQAQGRPGQ